jgi:6-pyruvoyltetrahydropterin/6-carboxytetrahydropterin synthase
MGYEVTRSIEWDMAHRIPLHGGRCQNLHGHRYRAEITCTAVALDEVGFVVDFGCIKRLVGSWVDEHWDHNTVYQRGDTFMDNLRLQYEATWPGEPETLRHWHATESAPTAENLAQALHQVASELLEREGLRVLSVSLWETPNCRARYDP